MVKVMITLVLVASLLLACRPDPRAARIKAGEAVINIGSDPRTLDPSRATDNVSARAIGCFIRGLTSLDENGKARPELAESWQVRDGGMTWIFNLRPAKWSNGDPVTAVDFQYAWVERMLNPEFKAEYAYMLFYIRGARTYYEARAKEIEKGVKDSELSTGNVWVTALRPDQLMVQLENPTPFFPELVAHHSYYPVCEKTDRANPKWPEKAQTYVGNGPFKMVEYTSSKQIIGEKNPDYWDAANVGLKKITLRFIEKESGERAAFDVGELDGTQQVPRPDLDQLRNRPEFRSTPSYQVYFLNFNCQKAIFKDPRVRRALSLAIDRKAIVKNITRAGEQTATGLVPPELYTDKPAGYFAEHDPEQARKLLAEAGYLGGNGFPKLRYIYNRTDIHTLIAQVVQEQWKRELGIDMEVEAQEFRVCIDNRHNGNFDVARNGWVADVADPINFLEIFDSKSENNDSHWENPAYDELLQKARREPDPYKRQAAYKAAEAYLMDAMPAVPIFFYTQPYLCAEGLNYRLNPMSLWDAARLAWSTPGAQAANPSPTAQ